MQRRGLLVGLSALSAASVAAAAMGLFEAFRYRGMAMTAEEAAATSRHAELHDEQAVRQIQSSLARQEQQLAETKAKLAALGEPDEGLAIISQLVGIRRGDDPKNIAYRLTDTLYQTNDGWGRDDHYSTPELAFVMTILGPANNLCSGLSQNLHWALDQFAIPNRYVVFAAQSFLDGRALGDTHELIEARIGGKVIALDPTFSVTYCDGDDPAPIDARAMVACARAGTLNAQPIGKTRPGRGLQDYYMPIQKLAVALQATGGGPDFYQEELPYSGWFPKLLAKYHHS